MAIGEDSVTVLLDWFINPNHAPLLIAEWTGAFKAQGLSVTLVPSQDPSAPPHRLAAGEADIAINYQPELYFLHEQGLPLVRVGGLIPSPLATLAVLEGAGVHSLSDLKGKRIGCAVTGVDGAILSAMLRGIDLTLEDVDLVNVGFDLVGALVGGTVDAAIGGYRTFEAAEIRAKGHEPIMFNVEDHSVPSYEELIFVCRRTDAEQSKICRFLHAIEQAVAHLAKEPQQCWAQFVTAYPELDNAVNRAAWASTLPLFARDPFAVSLERYADYGQFLFENRLLKKPIEAKALCVAPERDAGNCDRPAASSNDVSPIFQVLGGMTKR